MFGGHSTGERLKAFGKYNTTFKFDRRTALDLLTNASLWNFCRCAKAGLFNSSFARVARKQIDPRVDAPTNVVVVVAIENIKS